jgi:hypothetical protein
VAAEDVPPGLIATIGLHGSASTWFFNVIRELVAAAVGEAQVLALYADEVGQVPDEAARGGRHMVIKSHHGSQGLDAWLAGEQARVFLSVRDPRDACISMAQRFKAPLDRTVRWLANDCNRAIRLASMGHALLRYDDRFSTIGRRSSSSHAPSGCVLHRRRSRQFSTAIAPRRCVVSHSAWRSCRRPA